MRAEITVRITDTAREGEIPERTFSSTAPLSLELPTDADEFLESLDSLMAQTLSPIVKRLAAKVQSDIAKYLEEARKSGLRQPELPLTTAG